MIEVPKCDPMPAGWVLNPDQERVHSIRGALQRAVNLTGQPYCPCIARDKERTEDDVCPCADFRCGNGCKCTLYVREATSGQADLADAV